MTISTEIMIAALYFFYLGLKKQLGDSDRKKKICWVFIFAFVNRILSVEKLCHKILYSWYAKYIIIKLQMQFNNKHSNFQIHWGASKIRQGYIICKRSAVGPCNALFTVFVLKLWQIKAVLCWGIYTHCNQNLS